MIKELNYKNMTARMDVESEFEEHRFSTWLSKEPETISWIEEVFKKGDVFYDIGANIGVYSIFSKALYGDGLNVYSFEPAYHNFSKLCKNAVANGFMSGFQAYPLAVNDGTRLETIELASVISGSAMHVMKGSAETREGFKPSFVQGVMSVSLDELVERFGLPMPNHIKIDTDGLEEKILKGGKNVLKNKAVKSVLVEISTIDPSGKRIADIMKESGFNRDHHINTQESHSRARHQEKGSHFENVIFTKK